MAHRRNVQRRTSLASAAVLVALAAPPVAAAAERPRPEDLAAVAVYVEQIPTATGSRPTAAGSSGAPLSAQQSAALTESGAGDAQALERVSTSPAYGAPERRLPRPRAEDDESEPLAAAAGAAAETEAGRLVGLALGLLALTAALVAVLAAKRRRSGS